MVAGLAKHGEAIINELTPLSAHLLHMAVGIAGEAGELCKAVYGKNDVARIDKENVIEELGDLEFYLEGLRQGLQLARNQTVPLDIKFPNTAASDITVIKDNSIKLNIESSILLDFIKKSAFYVKPVKIEKVIESLTKINLLMLIIRDRFDVTYEETIEHNINKLATGENARYKDAEYSNERAIDRADKD
jgi:hypothetical protein